VVTYKLNGGFNMEILDKYPIFVTDADSNPLKASWRIGVAAIYIGQIPEGSEETVLAQEVLGGGDSLDSSRSD
jgi:hypothetical protein